MSDQLFGMGELFKADGQPEPVEVADPFKRALDSCKHSFASEMAWMYLGGFGLSKGDSMTWNMGLRRSMRDAGEIQARWDRRALNRAVSGSGKSKEVRL